MNCRLGRGSPKALCFRRTRRSSASARMRRVLRGLIDLALPAVISSRPVWNGKRLANEAFVLENGVVRPLHRKQYFPNEPGWFESEWYAGDGSGFAVAEVLGIKVGVLLCTEAMFNERARAYGKQTASLIVIPRASGVNIESWKIAGAMASLVSGAYVVSSNRIGRSRGGTQFGGGGFAYAPQGRLLAVTSSLIPWRRWNSIQKCLRSRRTRIRATFLNLNEKR